jgi:hypothetical protein
MNNKTIKKKREQKKLKMVFLEKVLSSTFHCTCSKVHFFIETNIILWYTAENVFNCEILIKMVFSVSFTGIAGLSWLCAVLRMAVKHAVGAAPLRASAFASR